MNVATTLRYNCCRFVLKEDYDFTCQHIEYHGSAVRLNRLFVKALHRINPGGAVADRNSSKVGELICVCSVCVCTVRKLSL